MVKTQPLFFDHHFDCGNCVIPKVLPFFHTCDSFYVEKIMEQGELFLSQCNVHEGEQLLYLFYGKPAYKSPVNANGTASNLKSLLPVSFVVNPQQVMNIKRAFAFDSGAFHEGLYKDHLHPNMSCSQFSLTPQIDAFQKTVSYFFGDNTAYLEFRPMPPRTPVGRKFTIESYYSIISSVHTQAPDDRRAVIEIQLDQSMKMSKENIMAVILPGELMQDTGITHYFEQAEIEMISYKTFGARKNELYGSILDSTSDFLTRKNFLP